MAPESPLKGPLTAMHAMTSSSAHSRFQSNEEPIRRAHWSTYSYVHLVVSSLPVGVTTFDIYRNFQRFGNVSKISIFDRRQDDRSTRAEVYFEPPPTQPIWEPGRVQFEAKDGSRRWVGLKLSKFQPKSFKVESPVHRGLMFNEKTELLAGSLTWGVLTGPRTMKAMFTAEEMDNSVRIVLNLYRREIEVLFPFLFRSETRSAVRTFRFMVALDDDFAIWSLPNRRYVLNLSGIPWYSKQLKEAIGQTHSKDAKRWSEEDTWARQTDVFDHKNLHEVINKTPVSLQKNLNTINVARWTTFKFDLLDTEENKAAERVFRSALRDFNITVHSGQDFNITEPTPNLDLQVWGLINGPRGGKRSLSLAEELSQVRLPFTVRYQLEVCISHGWFSEYTITPEFLHTLASTDEAKARQMLKYVDSYQQRVWDPMEIFDDLRYSRPIRKRLIPENCVEVHSVTVTATSLIWNTPTVEITNRVIRKHKKYSHRFLRVHFEDDTYRGQSRLYASSNNKMILIFARVKRVLLHGIHLGDIHYEFLAWGNSQLRDHGVYFFAQVEGVTASTIRHEMGVFDQERVVAKRAARMGQCFSTTRPINFKFPPVRSSSTIPDIMVGPFNFTDGVGKISPLAAGIVSQQLQIKGPIPSAFQFRLGGCKGVLVVWPDMPGIDIKVRASQFKFDSTSEELEIIRCSEFWQPFLNRQLILCLSHLGVPDKVFLSKQEETIRALHGAMNDDSVAIKALRGNIDPNMMTLSMVNLVTAGFRRSKEPFVTSVLRLWKAWSLKYLKEKAKIPIPQGAFVLGCVDETNTLRGHFAMLQPPEGAPQKEKIATLPEIFIQITNPQTGEREVVEGVCGLARNPSLHPGDIRVVKAVDVQALRHLSDVVVMPATGDQDVPNMCSGGDLDGDDYIVFWDQELIPAQWNKKPQPYQSPTPKTAVGEISTEHIIEFFYDYLQNDYLGRIAHAHLAAGDFLDDGIEGETCLKLARLHSTAVDYPKTGIPAILERKLERNAWPHFMEKKTGTYKSRKVLGKLYDAVERVAFKPTHDLPFDRRILNASRPDSKILEAIIDIKQDYDNALQRIMAQHSIETEFEVWSTFVLVHSKASRDFKFHEEIGRLSSTLKERYHAALCELAGGKDFDHLKTVAVAAYQYTNALVEAARKEIEGGKRQNTPDSMPFISFPWLLQDTLCKIARQSDDLVVEEGSTAVFRDGNLVASTTYNEFDEQGRAQIRVRDQFDVELRQSAAFSDHLPDPYQPVPANEEAEIIGENFGNTDTSSARTSYMAQQTSNIDSAIIADHALLVAPTADTKPPLKLEETVVIPEQTSAIHHHDSINQSPKAREPSPTGDEVNAHVSSNNSTSIVDDLIDIESDPVEPETRLNIPNNTAGSNGGLPPPLAPSPHKTRVASAAVGETTTANGRSTDHAATAPAQLKEDHLDGPAAAGVVVAVAAAAIDDPLDMTTEQLKELGLPDDMEL